MEVSSIDFARYICKKQGEGRDPFKFRRLDKKKGSESQILKIRSTNARGGGLIRFTLTTTPYLSLKRWKITTAHQYILMSFFSYFTNYKITCYTQQYNLKPFFE